jgi:hypothetical protein
MAKNEKKKETYFMEVTFIPEPIWIQRGYKSEQEMIDNIKFVQPDGTVFPEN